MKNANYNLLNILTQKLQAIWRYDKYIEDARENNCPSCVDLWESLKRQDQAHIEKLRAEIESHVQKQTFE